MGVLHHWRVEALERPSADLGDARRLVLEPGLVRLEDVVEPLEPQRDPGVGP